MGQLEKAIVAAARSLPKGQIEQLDRALQAIAVHSPSSSALFEASASGISARLHAKSISNAWSESKSTPGTAIGFALRVAAQAVTEDRVSETIEIAWTGPTTPSVPVRRTSTILINLIDECKRQLIVMSFAAYKIPEVVAALRLAADRGVDVVLVLEGAEESGGALSFDAKKAFTALRGKVRFFSWPIDQRLGPQGRKGTLHAKAVIADGERALVTSANLTGSALDINMELGLVVDGGSVPSHLSGHIGELISRGILRQVV
jgi:phosphatidylserine/phosphatidylglycerophosphate/cardiolipin synthase-like enzyme